MFRTLSRLFVGLAITSAASAQVCPGDDTLGNGSFSTAESVTLTSETFGYISLALVAPFDSDVFSFTLGDGDTVKVDAYFSAGSNDLDLAFFDENQNNIFIANATGNNEFLTYTNATGAPRTYYVSAVKDQFFGCIEYSIDFSLECDPDDSFEPNDTCALATVINGTSGTHSNLRVFDVDEDHYWFDLAPGETLDAGIAFSHQVADLDIELLEFDTQSCGATLATGTSVSDDEAVTYTNGTGALQSVVLRVYVYDFDGPCNDYALNWSITQGPCSTPDAFEPNQSVCGATTAFGVFDGLRVSSTDEDHYELVTPDAGNRVSFAIDFDGSAADIDLELYEVTGDCTAPVLVDSSRSVTGRESVSAIVSPGSPAYVVRVFLFGGSDCAEYAMVGGFGVASDISDVVCQVELNSAGRPGITRATGSSSVLDDDVTLLVSDAPPGQFGIFLVSRTPGFVPGAGGSEGILCLGGNIGRFVGPGQIQATDATGEVTLPISLGQIPQGFFFDSVAPGERWYFQFWHRDVGAGGPTSNYAAAAKVDFE